jgi:hypothetical protein
VLKKARNKNLPKTQIKINKPITELVRKDAALSYTPHDIYEIIEGDEYDAITYDYEKVEII